MPDINLLPQEKKESGPTSKLGRGVKKISSIALILLLVGVAIYGGVYLYFFITERLVSQTKTQLEGQIQALEPTEQKFILIRDRIKKAGSIFASATAKNQSNALIDLQSSLPAGVTIHDSTLLPSELDLSISANQSDQITEFIRTLKNSGKYQQVELVSMSFSNIDHYLVELKIHANLKN